MGTPRMSKDMRWVILGDIIERKLVTEEKYSLHFLCTFKCV